MRIFVLEDDPARIAWFEARLRGHDVTYADSVTQADRYQPPYALVCLDHDLGGRQMAVHEDDGEQFALAIWDKVVMQPGPAPLIVVHSFNPDGARRIAALFTGMALIAPFRSHFFDSIITRTVGVEQP